MDFKDKLSEKQLEKWRRVGKRTGIILGILIALGIIALLSFGWITDYIWMGSLGFSDVYTTILGSKVLLGVIGFLLFLVFTYITFSWIRKAYINHFHENQLPSLIQRRKASRAIILGIAVLIGAFGSSIVQGIGWEPFLKLLNHASFGETDPYFNMDISFYIFILPFVKFIVFLLLGLSIFFLAIEIGAYSPFNIYRMSRSAQLHMGITFGLVGLLLACLHLLAPFETLLTNQVNIFQKSVVHGLSYTDKVVNIPKSYIWQQLRLLELSG